MPLQPLAVQVAAVAALVLDLNLDIYALRGMEASLEALLGELAQQATKHLAGDVTRQCLLAIKHCATAAPDAVQVCSDARHEKPRVSRRSSMPCSAAGH